MIFPAIIEFEAAIAREKLRATWTPEAIEEAKRMIEKLRKEQNAKS